MGALTVVLLHGLEPGPGGSEPATEQLGGGGRRRGLLGHRLGGKSLDDLYAAPDALIERVAGSLLLMALEAIGAVRLHAQRADAAPEVVHGCQQHYAEDHAHGLDGCSSPGGNIRHGSAEVWRANVRS